MRNKQEGAAPVGLSTLEIHPVTLDRWNDQVALFRTSPVMSSCWCMSPRTRAGEFSRFGVESRRRNEEGMRTLVESGTVPGLLAYLDGRPVGWISAGPRDGYIRLRRSKTAAQENDGPVWAIVCLYTERAFRRQGITRALIRAAVQYAADHGAAAVEAYPLAGWGQRVGASDAYTGMASTYRALGFTEVGVDGKNRGQPRLVMRCELRPPAPQPG